MSHHTGPTSVLYYCPRKSKCLWNLVLVILIIASCAIAYSVIAIVRILILKKSGWMLSFAKGSVNQQQFYKVSMCLTVFLTIFRHPLLWRTETFKNVPSILTLDTVSYYHQTFLPVVYSNWVCLSIRQFAPVPLCLKYAAAIKLTKSICWPKWMTLFR